MCTQSCIVPVSATLTLTARARRVGKERQNSRTPRFSPAGEGTGHARPRVECSPLMDIGHFCRYNSTVCRNVGGIVQCPPRRPCRQGRGAPALHPWRCAHPLVRGAGAPPALPLPLFLPGKTAPSRPRRVSTHSGPGLRARSRLCGCPRASLGPSRSPSVTRRRSG